VVRFALAAKSTCHVPPSVCDNTAAGKIGPTLIAKAGSPNPSSMKPAVQIRFMVNPW
jgi:hypothetical protein